MIYSIHEKTSTPVTYTLHSMTELTILNMYMYSRMIKLMYIALPDDLPSTIFKKWLNQASFLKINIAFVQINLGPVVRKRRIFIQSPFDKNVNMIFFSFYPKTIHLRFV